MRRRLTPSEKEVRSSAGVRVSRFWPFGMMFLAAAIMSCDDQLLQNCLGHPMVGRGRWAIAARLIATIPCSFYALNGSSSQQLEFEAAPIIVGRIISYALPPILFLETVFSAHSLADDQICPPDCTQNMSSGGHEGAPTSTDDDSDKPTAETERDKSKAKGVPDSQIGPSGKPKRHFADAPSRKRAEDAAKAGTSRGQAPIEHSAPTKGKPHFHPVDASGNKIPGPHYTYPKR